MAESEIENVYSREKLRRELLKILKLRKLCMSNISSANIKAAGNNGVMAWRKCLS